jgi:predicted RecA/RadA family phage recombinase
MQQTMKAMRIQGECSNRVDYTPDAALDMGDVVALQNRIGVCTSPQGLAIGDFGSLETCGKFRIIKDGTSGPIFTLDDEVYYNTSTELAVDAPGSNVVYAGICTKAAGTNEDGVEVDINVLPPKLTLGYLTTTTTTTT